MSKKTARTSNNKKLSYRKQIARQHCQLTQTNSTVNFQGRTFSQGQKVYETSMGIDCYEM